MAERRRYSDDERASALAALAANKGNVELTARQLGMPVETLRCWARGTRHPESMQMRDEKKAPLADALEDLARKLAASMLGKVDSASLPQQAVALGIACEKMQLLRGKATSISGTAADDMTDDQLAAIASAHPPAGRNGAAPPA